MTENEKAWLPGEEPRLSEAATALKQRTLWTPSVLVRTGFGELVNFPFPRNHLYGYYALRLPTYDCLRADA